MTAIRLGTIPSETMDKRLVTVAVGLIGLVVFSAPARAQRAGAVAFAPAMRNGPVGLRGGPGGSRFGHARHSGSAGHGRRFIGAYGFSPYFYEDSETESVEPPPAQVIVMPPAPAATPAQPARPAESLLLERHGDTWVRISASGDAHPVAGDLSVGLTTDSAHTTSQRAGAALPPTPIPPAILIFRDGHTEQVEKYVIVGTTLYTSSNYWSTGSWTKKIPIAHLNVPETLKLNQQRGAKFALPSGPTEVMMRP